MTDCSQMQGQTPWQEPGGRLTGATSPSADPPMIPREHTVILSFESERLLNWRVRCPYDADDKTRPCWPRHEDDRRIAEAARGSYSPDKWEAFSEWFLPERVLELIDAAESAHDPRWPAHEWANVSGALADSGLPGDLRPSQAIRELAAERDRLQDALEEIALSAGEGARRLARRALGEDE